MHTLSKPLGKYLMLLCVLYTHCTQDNLFGNTVEQGIFCGKIFVESRSIVVLNFCKLSGVASKHSCRHCTHQADYAKVRECRDNPHFSLKSLLYWLHSTCLKLYIIDTLVGRKDSIWLDQRRQWALWICSCPRG